MVMLLVDILRKHSLSLCTTRTSVRNVLSYPAKRKIERAISNVSDDFSYLRTQEIVSLRRNGKITGYTVCSTMMKDNIAGLNAANTTNYGV